jgi:Zincin-like metallopeptidase
VDFAEFERRAARVWEEIPDAYRAGVDGLVLDRDAKAHPSLEDIYTLGECLTEAWPSEWGGPDTTRSVLVLYHGSFRRLSELDPDFDWGYEIWETITHELRHHLESLATEDALEDLDYAMDENFKRLQGEPFDPFFYRSGEPLAPGVFGAERDVFVERVFRGSAPPFDVVELDWEGAAYDVEIPSDLADVTFVDLVEGTESEEVALCVVLVRKPGAWAAFRRWLRREGPSVAEAEATARRRS